MSWQDVIAAEKLITEKEPSLAVALDSIALDLPYDPTAKRNIVGRTFPWKIRLSRKYEGELSDEVAVDLLNTLIHESIHKCSNLFKAVWDFLHPLHPDVYKRADELTALLKDEYLARRRMP